MDQAFDPESSSTWYGTHHEENFLYINITNYNLDLVLVVDGPWSVVVFINVYIFLDSVHLKVYELLFKTKIIIIVFYSDQNLVPLYISSHCICY